MIITLAYAKRLVKAGKATIVTTCDHEGNTALYGRMERVLVLAVRRAGTIDVQRSDGQCYRVSGL